MDNAQELAVVKGELRQAFRDLQSHLWVCMANLRDTFERIEHLLGDETPPEQTETLHDP